MEKFGLLTELLPLLEQYQQTVPDADQSARGFGKWLSEHTPTSVYDHNVADARPVQHQFRPAAPGGTADVAFGGMPNAASAIGRLVIVLARYARRYAKMALDGSPFHSIDELTFLATVLEKPGIAKMEVITRNTQEKPLGMQIINQLIGAGYVERRTNPGTKRASALYLTPLGEQTFFAYANRLQAIGHLVVGNLDLEEQRVLYGLLDKLDAFHLPYYLERWDNFDQVLQDVALRLGKTKQ